MSSSFVCVCVCDQIRHHLRFRFQCQRTRRHQLSADGTSPHDGRYGHLFQSHPQSELFFYLQCLLRPMLFPFRRLFGCRTRFKVEMDIFSFCRFLSFHFHRNTWHCWRPTIANWKPPSLKHSTVRGRRIISRLWHWFILVLSLSCTLAPCFMGGTCFIDRRFVYFLSFSLPFSFSHLIYRPDRRSVNWHNDANIDMIFYIRRQWTTGD